LLACVGVGLWLAPRCFPVAGLACGLLPAASLCPGWPVACSPLLPCVRAGFFLVFTVFEFSLTSKLVSKDSSLRNFNTELRELVA